jgi:hypothetical protein
MLQIDTGFKTKAFQICVLKMMKQASEKLSWKKKSLRQALEEKNVTEHSMLIATLERCSSYFIIPLLCALLSSCRASAFDLFTY